MKSGTTSDRVIDIIARNTGAKRDKIQPEKSLNEDLGLDLLDMVELQMDLEDEFGIEIPDEIAEQKFILVSDVLEYVAEQLKEEGRDGQGK